MTGFGGPSPRTAIIIPTYNRREMVLQAVESALDQTRSATVVVVDDGSTDGTAEAVREAFGGRVRLHIQENRERGAARNAGAALAGDADLLVFLDADDLLLPDHVGAVEAAADAHPDASMIVVRARLVWGVDGEDRGADGTGPVPGPLLDPAPPGTVVLDDFLEGGVALPPTLVAFRSTVFRSTGGFPEERIYSGSEDWLLAARVLARGRGVRIPAVTALVRRHPANTMADAPKMEAAMRGTRSLLFRRYRHELPSDRVETLERLAWSRMLVNAATTHYGAGRMGDARRLLAEAVRYDWRVGLRDGRVGWTLVRSLLGPAATARLRRLKRWIRVGSPGRRRGG